MIAQLKKLSPETVEMYLETRDGESLGINKKLAAYILQIDAATKLHRKHHSISECAKHLQAMYPDLSIHTCKSRIYDSINYLNDACTVTGAAWYLYHADMYMKLFDVNLTGHSFREARTCLQHALDCRVKASSGAVDPERTRFKHQIVSPDITNERMRIERKGLLESYREALTLVKNVDANDVELKRLMDEVKAEFNIIDTAHEEVQAE